MALSASASCPPEKILTVASSFVLTGLGVLVRGASEQPNHPLALYALHTALAVRLVFADGHEAAITASVEEITSSSPTDAQTTITEPALLLQLPEPKDLPAGTEVWLTALPTDDWL